MVDTLTIGSTRGSNPTTEHNRFGLDYRKEAAFFAPPVVPILDAHLHINGAHAAVHFLEAAHLYGATRFLSMTRLEEVNAIRDLFQDSIRFIAMADYKTTDPRETLGVGFARRIRDYHALGSRVAKFWCAPRARDQGADLGDPSLFDLDAPSRRPAMDEAASLGMTFMAHVADPDTWFATKYANASRYGTKSSHYEALERAIDRYPVPWIIAHMGGWPENIDFLDGLLSRHANVHLDTSATKWMVRELGRYDTARITTFLRRWQGRIFFGSDTVTTDDHLHGAQKVGEMAVKASNAAQAFELYASRYWTLRTMWETAWVGESPIADPDLSMVDSVRYSTNDAPPLVGRALPRDLLESLYAGAATRLIWGP
ncbi:MAG: amidohydrolase family protein [Planctomycetota bacterium]|nr:amidohydrolase family protein [Planctomycetota bacterium]